MASPTIRRELLACCLAAILASGALGQSLGDIAREQRQKKASSAQSGAVSGKTFSNLESPPAQPVTPGARQAGRRQGGQALLQIDSPADGTVVSPGDTISVAVSSPRGAALRNIGVLGQDPIGAHGLAGSLPAHFSITIPREISSRRYMLTAVANNTAGELVESDPIELDVQRPDMPLSLSEVNYGRSPEMIADAQGETQRFLLLAHFADGSLVDVTESRRLSFHSTDSSIVTVDEAGTAMAVASGHAEIIVSYSNPSGQDVQLRIPVTVMPFRVTVEPSSLDFGEVPVGSSAKLSLTVTNNTVADNLLMFKVVSATQPYSETDNCVSSSPVPVHARCEITVIFRPDKAGLSPGTLSIVNSSSMVPSVILLSGVGSAR